MFYYANQLATLVDNVTTCLHISKGTNENHIYTMDVSYKFVQLKMMKKD